jgi:hypothetical protein
MYVFIYQVASWGAYLWSRNVVAMSFAPRDSHEAQVQFALERGVPAVIGVLGTIKLPYPSRAFDMAHCSRCLIPWGANGKNMNIRIKLNTLVIYKLLAASKEALFEIIILAFHFAAGIYMMEVDRVLRPGGYWVLSGPPINWKVNYKPWQRPKEELEEEQRNIEEVAKKLCWEKKSEKAEIAIWQKTTDSESCRSRQDDSSVEFCEASDPDDVWYAYPSPAFVVTEKICNY